MPAAAIDRQCGSSQQAVHFAAQAVLSGTRDVVIAAGVGEHESGPDGINWTLHAKAEVGSGPFSEQVLERQVCCASGGSPESR